MKKLFTLRFLCLVLSLLLLSACTNPPTVPGLVITPTESIAPSPSDDEFNLPSGPAKSNVFSLPWTMVDRFLPLENQKPYNDSLANLVYEGLFEINQQFEPEALLCESYEVLEDGKSYIFKIRSGVSFHNGQQLTAHDVVYSILTAKNSAVYSNRLIDVASVVAIDDSHVEVRLSKQIYRFVTLLDFPIVLPSQNGFCDFGTGAYSFKQDTAEQNNHFLLSYDDWWQAKKLPIQRIELHSITNPESITSAFQNKLIAVISHDEYDPIAPKVHSGFERWNYNTTNMIYIGINTKKSPFNYEQFRTALSLSFNRKTIVSQVYQSKVNQTGLPYHPESLIYPKDLEYQPDSVKALEILHELGFEDGDQDGFLDTKVRKNNWTPYTLDIVVNLENPQRKKLAELYAQDLQQLGINANVRALDWIDYQQTISQGNYDLFVGEVQRTANFALDDFVLKYGSLNFSSFENRDFTDAIFALESASQTSIAKQTVDQLFIQYTPFIVVGFRDESLISQRGLISEPTPTYSNIFHKFNTWKINK